MQAFAKNVGPLIVIMAAAEPLSPDADCLTPVPERDQNNPQCKLDLLSQYATGRYL